MGAEGTTVTTTNGANGAQGSAGAAGASGASGTGGANGGTAAGTGATATGSQGSSTTLQTSTTPSTTLGGESGAQNGANSAAAEGGQQGQPAPIELKVPEGFSADEKAIGDFKKLAGELGLKSEGAQKVFEAYVNIQKAQMEAQAQKANAEKIEWEQTQSKWTESLKADKEFGGTNFDANVKTAMRAVHKFGTQEFRDLLNKTWVGNHPSVVKFMREVGKSLAEDTVAGTSGSGVKTEQSKEDVERLLYPTHFKKE